MRELNVNFTHDGADYNVCFTPRENYYIHQFKFGDKEFSVRVSFTNNYISVYKVDIDPFGVEDNQVHVQRIKKNKVKASKFLAWHLSDSNDYELLGLIVGRELFNSGKATLSVVDIFNSRKYIPSDICEQKEEEITTYHPSDILFEDDLTKMDLTDEQKMYYYNQ